MSEATMKEILFKASLKIQVGNFTKDFEVSKALNVSRCDSAKYAAELIGEMANSAAAPITAFYSAIVALDRANSYAEDND